MIPLLLIHCSLTPFVAGLGAASFVQAYAITSSSIPDNVVDEVTTKDSIVAKVKATIIVTGVLEAMTGFFLLQNVVLTKKLFTSLVKSQRAVKWRNQQIANEIGFVVKEEELENLSTKVGVSERVSKHSEQLRNFESFLTLSISLVSGACNRHRDHHLRPPVPLL